MGEARGPHQKRVLTHTFGDQMTNGSTSWSVSRLASSSAISRVGIRAEDARLDRILDALPSVEEVATENFGQRLAVPRFERHDHFLMFGHCRFPFFRALMADEAYSLQPGLQHSLHAAERLVMGKLSNLGVDRLIELVVAEAVARIVAFLHFVMQSPDFGNLFVRCRHTGEAAGQLFETFQHDQHVVHVLAAEPLDDRAAARNEFDQTLAGEILDRLAQGRARDAELLSELALVHPCSRWQFALDNHVAQPCDERVVKSRSLNRSGRRGWQISHYFTHVRKPDLGAVRL